jgi:hypothetical protein
MYMVHGTSTSAAIQRLQGSEGALKLRYHGMTKARLSRYTDATGQRGRPKAAVSRHDQGATEPLYRGYRAARAA